MRLRVNESALKETIEAEIYYEQKATGLGHAFLSELKLAADFIVRFSSAAPIVRGKIRQFSLSRFKYNLFYTIEEEEIHLIAVAHHKRRPFHWKDRQL